MAKNSVHYSNMRHKIEEGWKSAKSGRLLDGEEVFKELRAYSKSQRNKAKKK